MTLLFFYNIVGDCMKVKIFDEGHEVDLEVAVNNFIVDKEIVDIKFNVSVGVNGEDQIYCFSALIMYKEKN